MRCRPIFLYAASHSDTRLSDYLRCRYQVAAEDCCRRQFQMLVAFAGSSTRACLPISRHEPKHAARAESFCRC